MPDQRGARRWKRSLAQTRRRGRRQPGALSLSTPATSDETAILSRQFLRALRGRRSQVAWSRRLGYASNVSAEWESGRRCPSALVVLQACKRLGVPLGRGFEQLGSPGDEQPDPLTQKRLASWLDGLRRGEKVSTVAARANLSRYQVTRFVKAQSQPSLRDFFALLEGLTGKLRDFLAVLVDPEQVPLLARHRREVRASRALAFERPWSAAVLAQVECQSAPRSELVRRATRAFGLSATEVEECLSRLEEAGLVREIAGHYRVVRSLLVDTRAGSEAALGLRHHWALAAAERIKSRHPGDLIGYNVFTASHRDLRRIAELQLEFYRRVRAIVADSPAETVALMNLQLINWFPDAEAETE